MTCQRLRATTLAMCLAGGILAILAAVPAHATPPAVPCDYGCLWPIGSYDMPASVRVGETLTITYTYAWEEMEGNDRIGTLRDRAVPPGHYEPANAGALVPPPGYAGSTVTLTLPQEIAVVEWERDGFARELVWTDANGHATYEYTRPNAHLPGARSATIGLVVAEALRYPNTGVTVDLGVRDAAASMPLRLFANQRGDMVYIGAHVPLAVGQASDIARHTSALPESAISPLRGWELPAAERARVAEFMGARPAVSGTADVPGMAYVYGRLMTVGTGHAVVPGADVMVCLHDVGNDGAPGPRIAVGANTACSRTSNDGFYGIEVPTDDPDGEGTADIVVRFSLVSDEVTIRSEALNLGGIFEAVAGRGATPNMDLPPRTDATGPLVGMGTATVPARDPFGYALMAYTEIKRAHDFFESELGYDAPLAEVGHPGIGSLYYSTGPIGLTFDSLSPTAQATVFHEYGHFVQARAYGGTNFPISNNCNPHRFEMPTDDACAWNEGWAEFVAQVILDDPVPPGSARGNLETRTLVNSTDQAYHGPIPAGSRVEGNVMAVLWDIYDAASAAAGERDDSVSDLAAMWATITDAREGGELFPQSSIHDFRDDWHDNGYTGLDAIMALNAIEPRPRAPSSLTAVAQDSTGSPKPNSAAAHVRAGERIAVSLTLASPSVGGAPMITFAGSPAAAMVGSGSTWTHSHTVPAGAPEGPARFTIQARSMGVDVTLSEHSITSGGGVTIDTTPPARPEARFTADNEITLAFDGPLDTASVDSVMFPVRPPSGPALSLRGEHDGAESTVRLALPSPATADATYNVDVPSTIADLAGNTHAGSSVRATPGADSTPPTFTAMYTDTFMRGSVTVTVLTVEFSEPVRPVAGNPGLDTSSWQLSTGTPERPRTPTEFSRHIGDGGKKFSLEFKMAPEAGTLEYSPPSGVPDIEDAAGNPLEAGSVASVGADVFLPRLVESMADGTVVVNFGEALSGKTRASEWTVGGVMATGVSAGGSAYSPVDAAADLSLASERAIRIGHAAPASVPGSLEVRYTRPTGDGANELSAPDGQRLETFSVEARDALMPRLTAAAFTGPQTIELTASEPLDAGSVTADTLVRNLIVRRGGGIVFDERPIPLGGFTAGGLGELDASYSAGTRTITLTASADAGANVPYAVQIPRKVTDTSGNPLENLEVTLSRSDTTAPALEGQFALHGTSEILLVFSEPLRPGTVGDGAFKVTRQGSQDDLLREGGVSYLPFSRLVRLTLEGNPTAGVAHTVGITADTIRDLAGNLLPARSAEVTFSGGARPDVEAAFEDQRTVVVSYPEPPDAHKIAAMTYTAGALGTLEASHVEGSTDLRLASSVDAVDGESYEIGKRDRLAGIGRIITTPLATATYADTHAPVPRSAASVSTTVTEVRFGEDVAFGGGVTLEQHKGHWTVAHEDTAMTIKAVSVKAGEASTVAIEHDALPGTDSRPTVTYTGGADDAGRVRDTAGTPNVQGDDQPALTADDATPPSIVSLSASPSKAGTGRADNAYVRAGDSISVSLALSEAAGSPPSLVAYGDPADMELSAGTADTRWVASYAVPAGAAQGAAEFGIVARDASGAEAVYDGHAVAGGVVIDTLAPRFVASTRSATETAVTLSEPARGTVVASDWLVGGARATGVAIPGAEPAAVAALPPPREDAAQSFVLVHAPLSGTPTVEYSPRAS